MLLSGASVGVLHSLILFALLIDPPSKTRVVRGPTDTPLHYSCLFWGAAMVLVSTRVEDKTREGFYPFAFFDGCQ